MNKKAANPRLAVVDVLNRVLQKGESLNTALPAAQASLQSQTQRAYVQAISNGVLRDYHRLQAILIKLLQQPLKAKDQDIQYLLLIGLHELIEQRSPDYAVVSEIVESAVRIRKHWAKGLLNGVLRNFIRDRETLQAHVDSQPEARFSSPAWLIETIQHDWPNDWESILTAARTQAPMVLRVNLNNVSRENYLSRLSAMDIEAKILNVTPSAIQLASPCDVFSLPGFEEGDVSVQDAAAQWAGLLLEPKAGERVLDACAAPGGKTLHILQQQPGLSELVAVEINPKRINRIEENIRRAGSMDTGQVKIVTEDVTQLEKWWDGTPFQKILLDVPCSASGVIRRHPDIKVLRRDTDMPELVRTQARLLSSLWSLLADDGVLLYCTCSVFSKENEMQIAGFAKHTPDCIIMPLQLPVAYVLEFGCQFLPGVHETDGFYYAALRKQIPKNHDS